MRIVIALALLCLALAAVPARADYEDGPINGTVDAWTINFGFLVSDTFVADGSRVTGFEFGAWEFPSDTVTSVDWFITSGEFGGTIYGSGTASTTDRFISVNQYGYDIDEITATGLNVALTPGTKYWLTLANASLPSGDPVYWDENDGKGCQSNGCPSQASENSLGSLGAESFTINTASGGGTTPEPGTFLLLASGILGAAGFLRRKLL